MTTWQRLIRLVRKRWDPPMSPDERVGLGFGEERAEVLVAGEEAKRQCLQRHPLRRLWRRGQTKPKRLIVRVLAGWVHGPDQGPRPGGGFMGTTGPDIEPRLDRRILEPIGTQCWRAW